jgi:hypothetical protein
MSFLPIENLKERTPTAFPYTEKCKKNFKKIPQSFSSRFKECHTPSAGYFIQIGAT